MNDLKWSSVEVGYANRMKGNCTNNFFLSHKHISHSSSAEKLQPQGEYASHVGP